MARKRKTEKTVKESERRRQARERREKARKRQREATLRLLPEVPAPLMTIRIMPKALKTGSSNIVVPMLLQNRPAKHIEGQHKMSPLVKHLNVALGVQTLLAYHGLFILLGTGALAKEELLRLRGGPGNIDYRLRIGRENLENWTGFDSEDHVKQWANNKYAHLKTVESALGFVDMRAHLIEAETEAVRFVFRAYERAQIVLAANNEAANMDNDKATAHREAAFSHARTHLAPFEVLQVAIFADIETAALWPQYADGWGQTFKFARFLGRVDAGVEATLNADQFELARKIINAERADAGLSALWAALHEKFNRHFLSEKFDLAIHIAEITNGIVRVSRSMRELSVETTAGTRYVIQEAS